MHSSCRVNASHEDVHQKKADLGPKTRKVYVTRHETTRHHENIKGI